LQKDLQKKIVNSLKKKVGDVISPKVITKAITNPVQPPSDEVPVDFENIKSQVTLLKSEMQKLKPLSFIYDHAVTAVRKTSMTGVKAVVTVSQT